MSQSPVKQSSPEAVQDYFLSWQALGSMIRRGRSFSGRERNCAFLNLGTGRWSDVSSVAGLDQIDDGRAVALSDWDQDGDLDLWLANRTAPRVRFLRNDLNASNHYLQLRLVGKTCNRDAIGARVELHLAGASQPQLIGTVRAGDGFVSQSTKWIHFGIPPEQAIERLIVRWPNETEGESFAGIELDQRFELVQGTGRAELVPRRTGPSSLRPSVPVVPESSERARIVLTERRDLPDLEYEDLFRNPVKLKRSREGPTLINLWASWCLPCVAELSDLGDSSALWQTKKLKIIALCADLLTPEYGDDLSAAMSLVKKSDYPFEIGVALPESARELSVIHNLAIYRERPLPLPSSFLVDRRGRVAVIYRGPVTSRQLLADLERLDAPVADRKSLAFPFAGRDGIALFSLSAIGFAQAYQEAGYFADAEQELVRFLVDKEAATAPGTPKQKELGYHSLGLLLQRQQRWNESAAVLRKALAEFPQSSPLRVAYAIALWHDERPTKAEEHLQYLARVSQRNGSVLLLVGTAYLQLGQYEQAVDLCRQAAALTPADPEPQLKLAIALQAQNKTSEAIALYRRVLKAHPNSHDAMNNLAWIYATTRHEPHRAGSQAVAIAARLCAITAHQNPAYLDTLSVAYAEVGDFEQATSVAHRAIDLAFGSGQIALARQLETRLALFRESKPYRESPRRTTTDP